MNHMTTIPDTLDLTPCASGGICTAGEMIVAPKKAKPRARRRKRITREYREGFIDGYLRAHSDGNEYACSVRRAKNAFAEYKNEGGRALPREDIPGW